MIDPTNSNDANPNEETEQTTEVTEPTEGAVSDADLDNATGAGSGYHY